MSKVDLVAGAAIFLIALALIAAPMLLVALVLP